MPTVVRRATLYVCASLHWSASPDIHRIGFWPPISHDSITIHMSCIYTGCQAKFGRCCKKKPKLNFTQTLQVVRFGFEADCWLHLEPSSKLGHHQRCLVSSHCSSGASQPDSQPEPPPRPASVRPSECQCVGPRRPSSHTMILSPVLVSAGALLPPIPLQPQKKNNPCQHLVNLPEQPPLDNSKTSMNTLSTRPWNFCSKFIRQNHPSEPPLEEEPGSRAKCLSFRVGQKIR